MLNADGISVVAVVTNPDKPAGRGKNLAPSPVKVIAEAHNIPVLQPTSIKRSTDAFIAELAAFGPVDIGIVVAFGQILPKALLEYPAGGCLNIHTSLLPRWRGAAPMQRAIMSGDTETGVCLMKMEEGLDTGPVYSSKTISILETDTLASIHDSLAIVSSETLIRDLPAIVAGKIQPVPQPSEGVTYAEKIKNDEACINWDAAAQEICWHIHGLSPFPGSFTYLNNQRLKIFSARALPGHTGGEKSVPGTVTHASGHELRVACRDGEVALLELQLEGKKRLPANEFIKGFTSALLGKSTSVVLGKSDFSSPEG